MNTVDLAKLETLTKDYAAFQARKSGLATALGGLMAVLLLVVPMRFDLFAKPVLGRSPMVILLFTPLLWLLLKAILGRWLYHGLGQVKAIPDLGDERRRWVWIFGIAVFLVAFQTAALGGFTTGVLGPAPECLQANPGMAAIPGTWVIGLPTLYLLAAPWGIRGVEEARAYAVQVGLCAIWIWTVLLFRHLAWRSGPENMAFTGATVIGGLLLSLAVLAWASLAMIRGWREHREYLALLKSLPREGA